jgi:type II secretory pathway component GspD/PulD (secretin)
MITDYALTNLDRLVSLDVIEPMEVADLLKFLALKGDLNVIVGREVAGTTKLMLKEVALGEALEIVLAANGLAYEVKGNIIKVMTDKEYRELHGEGFYERKQAKIIELKYASPKNVALILAEIKSSIGKIVADDVTGTLVLIDTPEKILEMEAVIRKAELPTIQRQMPTVTTNFVLQYAKVEDLEPQVTPMLTRDVGQVHGDKRTKTLIVTDLPHIIARIAHVVAAFDVVKKQVFIEAKIVNVRLSDEFKMGVNWDYLFQGLDPRFSLSAASQFPLLDLADKARRGTLTYHTIAAGNDVNSVIEALQSVGDTKLLSNPHIAVLDGEEASIKVIQQQPYAELQFESGSTNVVGKTYKFIDVGVTLGVTPRINEQGFITVDIKPDVSSIIGTYDTAGGQGVPIVKKSVAETSVSVKDGVTIIIGGLIDEVDTKETVGLPLLSRIPFLGALFRTTITVKQNSELIVLLTPRIVTGDRFFERSKDIKKQPRSVAAVSAPAAAVPPPAEEPL